MSVYKDTKNNTWKVYYRFTDWQGKVHQSTKRGFPTKREALAWEREQLHKVEADLDMTFESFIDTYTADMKNRLKENTWHTKEHIIRTKLLPYFAKRKMNSIQPKDIIAWQNEMIKCRDKSGEAYSPVYLKTLHNQLSAIFNHAVKFYGLKDNPAAKVGNMGKAKAREMLFWTQEEYKKFSEEMMDKPGYSIQAVLPAESGLQAQCAIPSAEHRLCAAAARSRYSLQGKPQSRWTQNHPVEGDGTGQRVKG